MREASAGTSPFLRRYASFFIVYAVVAALYLAYYASGHAVPEAYKGTPADPATFLSAEQLRQSAAYSALGNWLFLISSPWEWGLYLVLLFGGYARAWEARLQRTGWPLPVRFGAYVLLLQLAAFVAFFPLRVCGYALARHYGISTQPALGWLRDKAVAFGVNYALMLAVSAVALWLIGRGGRWWLKLWLLSVPFTLFMMYIQPVVIDPLYNQYSRLSNPELEQRILALAAKADIPADRVYEVNMSKKTNALNAYVSGLGGSLRIVLWDTTLQRLTEKEILLIMAHEMGHYAMHHLEWSAFGAVAASLALLWLGSRALRWTLRRYGPRWGIRHEREWAVLPVALLLLSLLSFVAAPVENAVSRQAEQAADVYGLKLIGSADGAVTMYQKLASSALSNVNPPPLIKWLGSTHPSIMERIVYAEQFRSGVK